MDNMKFRDHGVDMIEYITNYIDNIEDRRITSSVQSGSLMDQFAKEAPMQPESWEEIMSDVDTKIMPGLTHWHHPRFHAYFPLGNSFPSILGDVLSDAIACVEVSSSICPASTELEKIVTNWMGRAIGLPEDFLTVTDGSGGGFIENSTSECILTSLIAARTQALNILKKQHPKTKKETLLSKLMVYCSNAEYSAVIKAAIIAFVKVNILKTDEKSSLRGETLISAIEKDIRNGFVPFFVVVTLGTSSSCGFDDLVGIAKLKSEYPNIWLHVNAAYAGNAFICPEFQDQLKGIEAADSFSMNTNKWLPTGFDCTLFWVKNRNLLESSLPANKSIMNKMMDCHQWGLPLTRRFRALKLWFVVRCYGITGLQALVRHHCSLAKLFEQYVLDDSRFEVCNEIKTGIVCFRLNKSNKANDLLVKEITTSGKLHISLTEINKKLSLRFFIVASNCKEDDVNLAWNVISDCATEILKRDDIDDTELMLRDECDLIDTIHTGIIEERSKKSINFNMHKSLKDQQNFAKFVYEAYMYSLMVMSSDSFILHCMDAMSVTAEIVFLLTLAMLYVVAILMLNLIKSSYGRVQPLFVRNSNTYREITAPRTQNRTRSTGIIGFITPVRTSRVNSTSI